MFKTWGRGGDDVDEMGPSTSMGIADEEEEEEQLRRLSPPRRVLLRVKEFWCFLGVSMLRERGVVKPWIAGRRGCGKMEEIAAPPPYIYLALLQFRKTYYYHQRWVLFRLLPRICDSHSVPNTVTYNDNLVKSSFSFFTNLPCLLPSLSTPFVIITVFTS